MRSYFISKRGWGALDIARNVARRMPWVYEGLTFRKAHTIFSAIRAFMAKSQFSSAYPVILKVDISPVCNLRCPTCVHADPGDDERLQRQRFSSAQRMSVERFTSLVQQVAGRSCAVSLYYLGDPLAHPDLAEICRVSRNAGLNVHISSNLSFRLSDEKLESLVCSGVTHFSVCVDGVSQATYGRTRVGGDIELVLHNLNRIMALTRKRRLRYPKVEIQFVKFAHNEHEIASAWALADQLAVDQFTIVAGHSYNYTDVDPGTYETYAPVAAGVLPKCWWPYLYMLVRYDGDIIPCCTHRIGEQYDRLAERRTLGNVFEQGVAGVWNSPEYRATRRLVSAPTTLPAAERAAHFCESCPKIYATDYATAGRPSRIHATAAAPGNRRRLRIAS